MPRCRLLPVLLVLPGLAGCATEPPPPQAPIAAVAEPWTAAPVPRVHEVRRAPSPFFPRRSFVIGTELVPRR